jgi:hypothetical protein
VLVAELVDAVDAVVVGVEVGVVMAPSVCFAMIK